MLEDKVAVVYGAGGAIGSAVSRTFARQGARLFLAGRSHDPLERVREELSGSGGSAAISVIDVLDEHAVRAHARTVAEEAGGIDIAINAASFIHDQGTPILDLDLENFLLPIDRFLRALFNTSKAVASHMAAQRSGTILTLSTPASRMAVPGHLGYSAACAATEAFSRVLAAELGPSNVRVLCLRPHAIADAPEAGSYTAGLFEPKAAAMGLTVSEWLQGAADGTMLKRLPTLRQVADVAAFLASDASGAMTGSVVDLTCGAVAT